jgi:hypothetical protein
VNTVALAKEYSAAGPGLVFRLRLRSPNQALGYRLAHGPAPHAETRVLVRPPAPSRNGHD